MGMALRCNSTWATLCAMGIVVLMAVVTTSCSSTGSDTPYDGSEQGEPENVDRNERESERFANGRSRSVFERPMERLSIEFSVLRISAPRGAFTEDDRIWKLVTGSLPQAASTLHLADNGFRASVGRNSDRRALRRFLDSLPELRTALDHATPDTSRLVELEVGRCDLRQTVFYYEEGGRLRGLDFENAQASFLVTFEMRSVNLREVWLSLTPELEEPSRQKKWVITEQGAREVPVERKHAFTAITLNVNVPEDGFLLLGPTRTVYDRPLLGRPFFIEKTVDREDGSISWRESVYVVSPVVRSRGTGR